MTAPLQLLLPTGQIAPAGSMPPAAMQSHAPLLVMNDLMAHPEPPKVAFFEPSRVINLRGIHASWIDSMKMLGHNIDSRSGIDGTDSCLEYGYRFKIVALSLIADNLFTLPRLIPKVRELYPDAMLIAGGLGVVPELAKFVDVVVMGDGDIIFPILINLFSGSHSPQELKKLYARRVIIGPDGSPFEIKAPFGKRIVVRAGNKFEFGEERPLKERYEEDREKWFSQFGSPFPLGIRQYLRASSPVPISEHEIDRLFLGSLEFVSSAVKRSELQLYANRGCFGNCLFCSLNSDDGMRRPSVDRIMDAIDAAAEKGIAKINFGDELFIQSRHWVNALLDRIEAKEYHRKIEFWAQTRSDTLDEELLQKLIRLNFKIAIGVETLLPSRAEFIKKTAPGKGESYVSHAKEMIRMMMKAQTGGKSENSASFILAFKGEGPKDVIKELRAQLEFLTELWNEFGRLPFFSYNPHQLPQLGDRYGSYQPGEIIVAGHEESNWAVKMDVSETTGFFMVLKSRHSANGVRLHGVYEPRRFKWPENMREFSSLRSFDASNMPWRPLKNVFDTLPRPNDTLGDEYKNDWEAVRSFLRHFLIAKKQE